MLCYLEGLTNEEAARRLGCPKGTVQSRLSRGRDRLRERLGVEVSATFRNLPLRSALELLADQAELAVVKRGNAFYVTSPENAAKMTKKRAAEKMPGPPPGGG